MKQVRDISLEEILRIEEVRTKPRYSVIGYLEELEWVKNLLSNHIKRVEAWKKSDAEDRQFFGKLDDYLRDFEEE